MRVALASDWFLPRLGGIELQMRDLGLQLQARGHDVEIVTPLPGPPVVNGLPVRRLDVPRLPGAGIVCTRGGLRAIGEALAGGGYDVVHVHAGIVAPSAWAMTHAAQSHGIPTVTTFHSVLTHFEIPLWLLRGALGVRGWRVQWSAVSSVVAGSLRPLLGDTRVALLPNAVDPARWRREADAPAPTPAAALSPEAGHRSGRVRAIAVMRLHRRKRPRALVRMLREAAAGLPPESVPELRILGDGAEMPALRRLIARSGLTDRVALCGWQDVNAVRRALHDADVFLLPSRLEAFGIAALEARCTGLPVIAMRCSGARDFLRHEEDALLADSDAEFAAHLRRYAADPSLRARLRAAAAHPPAGFDWDSALARIWDLYETAGRATGMQGSAPADSEAVNA